ncbi:MAG: threonine ammonia-lyase IlvA [Flavobacteriaceae bacterium]|nr:threonine ammonia-lyase IlvA [Flavobacteriaceae bacterium]
MQKAYKPDIKDIEKAADRIATVTEETPLLQSIRYSKRYDANILLKREDLQRVRSYKIRGAFNKIASLSFLELDKGVVCASAGNHAQGVAFACNHLQVHGTIFMPVVTPSQKIEQTKMFGGEYVTIALVGDTFDDSQKAAVEACAKESKIFVHPFDDPKTIEGQGTVALELLQQTQEDIDYLFLPVGGGGLASGVSAVFSVLSPHTQIIGVEPDGAASMCAAFENNAVVALPKIDKFIDGAAVQKVGELTFEVCKNNLNDMISVPEGLVCQTILELYNRDAIVVEPAGALTLAALEQYKDRIKGKNVVCLVSGSNNDITRTAEIKERALLYANLKHYFIIRFPQRPGALKEFVADILGPNDDITHFEYSKKSSRENAPAVVGIQLQDEKDLDPLVARMKAGNFFGDYLNNKPDLFQYLI